MDKYTDLPLDIKSRVKKADQFIIDRQKAKEKGELLPAPPMEPPVEPPPVEPIVEPPIVEPPVEPIEPIVKPPPVEPTPTPATVSKEEYDRLQQELSTLRGKYDKEPAELARQVSFLTEQVRTLSVVPPVPKVEDKPKSLREILKDDPTFKSLEANLTPEVFEAWMASQEKVYELAGERAREIITQEVSKVDARFAQSVEERFWTDFNKAYPDWVTLKSTPEFQSFISDVDPLSGVQKYAIIKSAFDRRDLGGVVRFLDIATGKSATSSPSPTLPSDGGVAVQVKLASKVAPSRSSGPPISTKPATTMTMAEAKSELTNMANLKNRGLWKGTQEEYVKRDATLRKIISTGSRVQP